MSKNKKHKDSLALPLEVGLESYRATSTEILFKDEVVATFCTEGVQCLGGQLQASQPKALEFVVEIHQAHLLWPQYQKAIAGDEVLKVFRQRIARLAPFLGIKKDTANAYWNSTLEELDRRFPEWREVRWRIPDKPKEPESCVERVQERLDEACEALREEVQEAAKESLGFNFNDQIKGADRVVNTKRQGDEVWSIYQCSTQEVTPIKQTSFKGRFLGLRLRKMPHPTASLRVYGLVLATEEGECYEFSYFHHTAGGNSGFGLFHEQFKKFPEGAIVELWARPADRGEKSVNVGVSLDGRRLSFDSPSDVKE